VSNLLLAHRACLSAPSRRGSWKRRRYLGRLWKTNLSTVQKTLCNVNPAFKARFARKRIHAAGLSHPSTKEISIVSLQPQQVNCPYPRLQKPVAPHPSKNKIGIPRSSLSPVAAKLRGPPFRFSSCSRSPGLADGQGFMRGLCAGDHDRLGVHFFLFKRSCIVTAQKQSQGLPRMVRG
jgi:hypothetical protein